MLNLRFGWMLLVALLGFSGIALADPDPAAAVPVPDKGDTAWMMLSTLLVILMIIPGLALFYGGLVRAKNMLSVLAQVFTIFCVIAILWVVYGYSLAFTDGGSLNSFVGGLSKMFLKGVDTAVTVETFSKGVVIHEMMFMAFQDVYKRQVLLLLPPTIPSSIVSLKPVSSNVQLFRLATPA